jgi:hypothetical protein
MGTQRGERQASLRLGRSRHQDPAGPLTRCPERCLEQGRLAGARVALDDEDARMARHGVKKRDELRQLVNSTVQSVIRHGRLDPPHPSVKWIARAYAGSDHLVPRLEGARALVDLERRPAN